VEAAKESIGEKMGRNEWFDEECRVAIQEKKEENHVTEDDKVEQGNLSEYRRKANKICREKKRC